MLSLSYLIWSYRRYVGIHNGTFQNRTRQRTQSSIILCCVSVYVFPFVQSENKSLDKTVTCSKKINANVDSRGFLNLNQLLNVHYIRIIRIQLDCNRGAFDLFSYFHIHLHYINWIGNSLFARMKSNYNLIFRCTNLHIKKIFRNYFWPVFSL